MRLLNALFMLLMFGIVPAAAQVDVVQSSNTGVLEILQELKESGESAGSDSKPENFVDPLGPFGELPSAFEVEADGDVLENASEIDAKAKELAGKVLRGSESALPPLIAALQLSGLHIRQGGRELFFPVGRSQGLVVQAWEVQQMGRLARMGFAVALNDVGVWITGVAEGKDPSLLGKVFLDSVRSRAAAKSGSMRFWGRFIVELGRQSQFHPVDLLSQGTFPPSVQLDAVQLALVLRRFGGDILAATEEKKKSAMSRAQPHRSTWNDLRSSFLPGRNYSLGTAASFSPIPAQGADPCTMNQVDGTIGDLAAVIMTSLQGGQDSTLRQFLSLLRGGRLGDPGGKDLFNLALAYLKLALAYASFDAEFTMLNPDKVTESPAYLVRTKGTKDPGERKWIRMRAVMRSENMDFINCARPLLNTMGIDLNVEKAGAIGGSNVVWRLRSGGDLVEFYGGDTAHGRTDEQGYAAIGIEGMPQKQKIPDTAMETRRRALVGAQVSIKPTKMSQDFVDGLGVLTGGITALGGIPAEILYRTGFGFERGYEFDVIDYSEKLKFTFDASFHENGTCGGGKVEMRGRFKAEVVLEPKCKENEDECRTYYGKGNLQIVEPWINKQSYIGVSNNPFCYIAPHSQPLQVAYFSDTREIAVSFGWDTDNWNCTPGAKGDGWWWTKFLLSHKQDSHPKENEIWYKWRSNSGPSEGIIAQKVFAETSVAFGCNFVSEDTRMEIRNPD